MSSGGHAPLSITIAVWSRGPLCSTVPDMSLSHDSTEESVPSIPLTRRNAMALAAAGAVAATIVPATAASAEQTVAADPEPECVADLLGGS